MNNHTEAIPNCSEEIIEDKLLAVSDAGVGNDSTSEIRDCANADIETGNETTGQVPDGMILDTSTENKLPGLVPGCPPLDIGNEPISQVSVCKPVDTNTGTHPLMQLGNYGAGDTISKNNPVTQFVSSTSSGLDTGKELMDQVPRCGSVGSDVNMVSKLSSLSITSEPSMAIPTVIPSQTNSVKCDSNSSRPLIQSKEFENANSVSTYPVQARPDGDKKVVSEISQNTPISTVLSAMESPDSSTASTDSSETNFCLPESLTQAGTSLRNANLTLPACPQPFLQVQYHPEKNVVSTIVI